MADLESAGCAIRKEMGNISIAMPVGKVGYRGSLGGEDGLRSKWKMLKNLERAGSHGIG